MHRKNLLWQEDGPLANVLCASAHISTMVNPALSIVRIEIQKTEVEVGRSW